MIDIADTDRYTISIEKSKNRIYITHRGFWKDPADAPNYLEDVKKATAQLSQGFTGITDFTPMDSPTQQAWIVFDEGARLLVAEGIGKSAGVFGENAVTRMGAMRRASETGMKGRAFTGFAEAEKWLDE